MNVVKQCRDTGLVVLLALMPAAAGAQTPQTSSFAEVPRAIKLGQKVMVTDVDGHKTKGNVDAISASSITLLVRDRWGVDERRSFEQSAVTAIRRTDSLWNGFLMGWPQWQSLPQDVTGTMGQ